MASSLHKRRGTDEEEDGKDGQADVRRDERRRCPRQEGVETFEEGNNHSPGESKQLRKCEWQKHPPEHREISSPGLERSLVWERIAANSLHFQCLHEPQVRPQNAHPCNGAESRHESDEVAENYGRNRVSVQHRASLRQFPHLCRSHWRC